MSTQHEEMEMAHELDRIVRTAITMAGQIIERRARQQAMQDRQGVQQYREAALERLRAPRSPQAERDPRATINEWREALRDAVNGDDAAAQRFAALTPRVQRLTGLPIHQLLTDAVSDAASKRDDLEQETQAQRESDAALDDILLTEIQVPPEVEAAAPVREQWEAARDRRENAAIDLVREHTPEWFQRGVLMPESNPEREDGFSIQESRIEPWEALREFAATGQMPDEMKHRVWAEVQSWDMTVGDSPSTVVLPPRWTVKDPAAFEAYWNATATPERDQGWSTPDPSVAEALPDIAYPEELEKEYEALGRMQGAQVDQWKAAEALMDRHTPAWFREGSREQSADQLVSMDQTIEAMKTMRKTGNLPADDLHRVWARYVRYHPDLAPDVAVPSESAARDELAAFWRETGSTRDAVVDAGKGERVTPQQEQTSQAPRSSARTSTADRGTAPSKAKTPEEREHRRQAWAGAQEEFTSNMRGTPSAAEAKQAWDNAPRGVKYGLYWKHYDADSGRERAAKQPGDSGFAPSKAATPQEKERREQAWKQARADHREGLAAGTTAQEAAQRWKALDWQDQALYFTNAYEKVGQEPTTRTGDAEAAVSRERVVELNEVAGNYYRTQLDRDGSKGGQYMRDRLGSEVVDAGDFQLGYAPSGWTNLTSHLRQQAGATDEEIVGAGLGRVSSRGTVIDAFRDRAMIGVRDREGDLVGFVGRDLSGDERAPKYLNTGATPAFTKGDHLLGAAEAREGAPVLRVEGPFDVLAVRAASDGNVAGVAPLGTALTSTQADHLRELSSDGRVWLGTDADRAGRAAAATDYSALSERGLNVRHVEWNDGADPAQLLKESPDALRAYLGTLDHAPSAAPLAMGSFLEEHADDLRDGDAEAFDEVAALEDGMAADLSEQDAYALRAFTSQRLDTLTQRDEAAVDRSAERDFAAHEDELDADASDARDAGHVQEADRLEDQAEGMAEREGYADQRADSAELRAGQVYDRARETPLASVDALDPARTQEAQRARRVSAYGYTRSTQDMLNEQGTGRAPSAKPQVNSLNQGARRQRMAR